MKQDDNITKGQESPNKKGKEQTELKKREIDTERHRDRAGRREERHARGNEQKDMEIETRITGHKETQNYTENRRWSTQRGQDEEKEHNRTNRREEINTETRKTQETHGEDEPGNNDIGDETTDSTNQQQEWTIHYGDRQEKRKGEAAEGNTIRVCLLYTSPSPRDRQKSRMPSSA